jgi:hypothetical protein
MDEQTDTEQTQAALRDTVSAARPVETERRMVEAEPVQTYEAQRVEPLMPREVAFSPVEGTLTPRTFSPREGTLTPQSFSPLQPTEGTLTPQSFSPREGTLAPETFSQLQPLQAEHLAEPMTPLQPLQAAHLAEPMTPLQPLQPLQAEHLAEPMTPLQAREGTVAAEPTAQLRPMERTAAKRLPATQNSASQAGGSAGSGFQVDPEQYLAAVSPVLAAADQLSQLVTGLTAFLDHTQSTAPWGNDESGKKFAEGEKGYLKYSTDTQKGLKGMPDAVRYIADGLKAMAENYQATEEGTTSVFQDDGGGAVSVPQTGSYSAPVNVMTPLAAPRAGTEVHPSTNRRA